MRKRKIYIKKKLKYRIKVIYFIIFTVLILNCVNNILKSFRISVKTYEDTLKRAYDMGNLIGSHTYNHKNLFELNNNQIVDEIKKTNNVIKEVTGSNTLYLRPPYGNTNKNIKNLANMYNILWDLDTEDWKYKDKNKIAKYIINNAHDGGIILLHDLYETSIDGALLAMEELSKNGYAFVTIEEMATLKGITLNKASNYFNIK